MNPYDFVRIEPERRPECHSPAWHHRFVDSRDQALYSGQIEVDVFAETPLFIFDPGNVSSDPRRAAGSKCNQQGEYILPGSSLKGMLRSVAEALGNGCLTLFDGNYEPEFKGGKKSYKARYKRMVPEGFEHCWKNTALCITCRIFGMLKEGTSGVFLGKINVGDACAYPDRINTHPAIHTAALMGPRPHHEDFYLDEQRRFIAGRKFYFHHQVDKELPDTKDDPKYCKYILPLDRGCKFHFRLDFTGLEKDEFALLLLALTLKKEMRHKIGYAKPLGLGSVHLEPTRLTLIDYKARYTQEGAGGGKRIMESQERDMLVADFSRTGLSKLAMNDLQRIWRWPAPSNVRYYYPSKTGWFDTEQSWGKRIKDTVNTP